ncbi:hypothetical protein GAA99_22135 [Salmonella enterica]|nr:hypothetical protein [Salmonella enterica]
MSPGNLLHSPKLAKIIGVFAFLAPGRHLIRTSSLPSYGVASHQNSLYEQEVSIQRQCVQET